MKMTSNDLSRSLLSTGSQVLHQPGPASSRQGVSSDGGNTLVDESSDLSTNPLGEPDATTSSSSSMDVRNQDIEAHRRIDPAPTTTSSTTTPSFTAPGKSPTCPTCSRTFANFKGRRVHESRAHKGTFHTEAKQIAATKKRLRWSYEEHLLLAKAEASYTGPVEEQPDVAAKYDHLHGLFPERSREAIKNQCLKNKAYQEILRGVLAHNTSSGEEEEIPIDSPSGEELHSEEGIEDTTSVEDLTPTGQQWQEVLRDSILKEKKTAAHTCIGNRKRTDRQFTKWLKRHMSAMPKKPAPKPSPPISGNRATRRRKMRAAWMKAYERNPGRTAKLVLDGHQLDRSAEYPEGTTKFWKELYETDSVKWSGREEATLQESTKHQALLRPFTIDEVTAHMKSMRAGATGVDNISLRDIRKMPVDELAEWFNLFLLQGALPRVLKRFRTTLIPKKKNPTRPSEFRPISVGSFVRRLLTGMLARRMNIVETHHCQRGFKKMEGCALQSYTLRAIVDGHIKKPNDLHYAYMDVRKAFDSVSHDTLRKAYVRSHLPAGFIHLLEDMYVGNTTILSADPRKNIVRLRRGVLQGDPLSPTLFNLVMDDVASGLDRDIGAKLGSAKVNCLMFADDSVLLANTLQGLQHNVNLYVERMAAYGLELNASKCAAVHIKADRQHKRWYIDPALSLLAGEEKVPSLTIGQSYRYLGLTTNVNKGLLSAHEQLKSMLGRLSASVLKPQQRLAILKTNVIPGILFETTLEHRSDVALKDLDIRVRKEVRRWLHLPKDVPIPTFHTGVREGGLGIPSLRTRVPRLQMDRFKRLKEIPDPDEWILALLGSPYWRKANQDAAASLARAGVQDKVTEQDHWSKRLYASVDGSGMLNHSNRSGYSSQWIDPTFLQMSGREFVGAMHVRCNSLVTRERATRGRISSKGRNCPCCPDKRESLAHILQVCWRTQNHRIFRHNSIMTMIVNKLRKLQFSVVVEPRIPHGKTFLKPDIVAVKDGTVHILDPSIVACSRNLVLAESDKMTKYQVTDVKRWARNKYGTNTVVVAGLIMDWRGAWAPRSVKHLKYLGFKVGNIELMSFKILKLSRWIYQCVRDRTDA